MTRRYTSEIVNEIGPEKDIPAPDVGTTPGRDGLDLRHLLDEPGLLGAQRRHRQAARGRRLARPRGGDRPRRLLLPAGDARAAAAARSTGCRSRSRASATSAPTFARFVAEARRDGGRRLGLERRPATTTAGIDVDGRARPQARAAAGSPSSPRRRARSRTRSCSRCPATCSRPCALEQVLDRGERRRRPGEDRRSRARTARRRRRPTRSSRRTACSSIPDILANAGGVVVSYFEWVQGLQELFWKEEEVNRRLNEIVVARLRARPGSCTRRAGSPLRLAAYGLGVQRVAEATRDPGPLSLTHGRRSVYVARDCHLCERRARRARARSRGELGFADRGGRHHRRAGARAALPRVDPGGRGRRRAGLRLPRRAPTQLRHKLGRRSDGL